MQTSPSPLRVAVSLVATLVLLFEVATPVLAEKPKVKITAARVGFPPARTTANRDEFNQPQHFCKFASWAPVYVDLQVLEPVDGLVELQVETPDADAVSTTLSVPINLRGIAAGTEIRAWNIGALPYLRPAGGMGETSILVRTLDGASISEPFRIRYLRAREPACYSVLSLGARLSGFDLPRPTTTGTNTPSEPGTLRNGKVELSAITDIDQLPDHWLGYDAADLVILSTSDAVFLEQLFGDNPTSTHIPRRDALREWVRRGGRLVVAVGRNASSVSRMNRLTEMLPGVFDSTTPSRSVSELVFQWSDRESGSRGVLSGRLHSRTDPIAIAILNPKPGNGRTLIPPADRQTQGMVHVAIQGAYDLGRMTVIAFDLENPPFPETTERLEFWDWVLRAAGANRASIGNESRSRLPSSTIIEDEDELASTLRKHLDTFDDVPVISFGWVAVLIVLYILLIGPVEYYLLKKVLGRLELTWITFPIIVLTVCVTAYYSAFALKGRELKINKVDVVDVVAGFDPQSGLPNGRAYGTTWFTIFSPRIDTYTISATPARDWTIAGDPADVVLDWVGSPQSGRASLVRRRYSYHVEDRAIANGVLNVPIQVWSTKSFSANWAAELKSVEPAVESRLLHPPGADDLVIGTFVNRMPFPRVDDCVAFYGDKAYPLDTILSGSEVRLILDPSHGQPAHKLIQDRSQLAQLLSRLPLGMERDSPTPNTKTGTPSLGSGRGTLPLWGVLFHELALKNEPGIYPSNASIRRLDQSWRLNEHSRDQVIVVGRVPSHPGEARTLIQPEYSSTMLWLKGLPKPNESPPVIPGSARQETYVRLFLAVKPSHAR